MPTFPSTAESMNLLLGFGGKVVWRLNAQATLTFEQHPYHPDAPAWHRGPHWHLDTPGKRHARYLPGDVIPEY